MPRRHLKPPSEPQCQPGLERATRTATQMRCSQRSCSVCIRWYAAMPRRAGAPPGALGAESRRPTSVVDNSKLDLSIGQWITHDEFGDGVVEDLTGEGSRRVAHVDFERAGRKRLLVKIAPIRLAPSSP